MMPVGTTNESEEFPEGHVDYKQKYKALKKKLRLLVYEQECFLDELRKAQRKLLKVTRDRSFLLDRLIQHEKIEDSSDASDGTNSTDTDDGNREAGPAKRKKLVAQAEVANLLSGSSKHGSGIGTSGGEPGSKKKNKSTKKSNKSGKSGNQKSTTPAPKESPGQMTREELQRHLDSKQLEFCIEKATASLPMEIFSNDANHDSGDAGGEEEEDDLIIDVPH